MVGGCGIGGTRMHLVRGLQRREVGGIGWYCVVVLCGGIGGGIAWHWLWVQCNVLDRQQKEQDISMLKVTQVAVGPFFI